MGTAFEIIELGDTPDISTFAKLPKEFGFAIEYTNSNNNLRYYEPDFGPMRSDESRCLVETKGREDVDVVNEDRAAFLLCENATKLN
jgi:restriction endonuclease